MLKLCTIHEDIWKQCECDVVPWLRQHHLSVPRDQTNLTNMSVGGKIAALSLIHKMLDFVDNYTDELLSACEVEGNTFETQRERENDTIKKLLKSKIIKKVFFNFYERYPLCINE